MIPFSRPEVDEREVEAVARVLRSGWLTAGPETAAFEAELARATGAKHALAFTSCTAALHLTLAATLKPGDEVITTPITWPATANAIVLAGGRPVFVDVDRPTRNISIEAVRRAVTPRTRAVIPVHFAGLPVEIAALRTAAPNAFILEDAAHAIGARGVGPTKDACAFSFHPSKNLTTGEGGAITTDSDELAAKLRLLRWHGIAKDSWTRHQGGTKAHYDVVLPGYKQNTTDIQSAIGRVQLEKLPRAIARRAELAALYRERLRNVEELELPVDAPGHAWHIYAVVLARGNREELLEALAARGVMTGVHFLACHRLTYYRESFPHGPLPEAERIGERIFSLPLFPGMTASDVEGVARALEDCLARR